MTSSTRENLEVRLRDLFDGQANAISVSPRTAADVRITNVTDIDERPARARAVVFTAVAVVVIAAIIVGSIIGFRHRTSAPVGSSGGAKTIAAAEFYAAVHGAPYHVLVPRSPGLTLIHAASERGKDSAEHEVYTVDLFYQSAHGSVHVWMAERSWSASVLGYDIANTGRPTTIAGAIWHVVTLPRAGHTELQLTRATSDGAVVEIDGPFDLPTMSSLATSLQ